MQHFIEILKMLNILKVVQYFKNIGLATLGQVFNNSNAILKIFGTKLDYVDKKVQSGFVFINPNEKGRCGCGESFLL